MTTVTTEDLEFVYHSEIDAYTTHLTDVKFMKLNMMELFMNLSKVGFVEEGDFFIKIHTNLQTRECDVTITKYKPETHYYNSIYTTNHIVGYKEARNFCFTAPSPSDPYEEIYGCDLEWDDDINGVVFKEKLYQVCGFWAVTQTLVERWLKYLLFIALIIVCKITTVFLDSEYLGKILKEFFWKYFGGARGSDDGPQTIIDTVATVTDHTLNV
jgi:hypothetical protein